MCGVVAISSYCEGISEKLYFALIALQHRGQDMAGMATFVEGKMVMRKAAGLVWTVFKERHMQKMQRAVRGIGHVRYPTAGSDSVFEAQPFYTDSPYGITLAHNGNIVNTEELREDLTRRRRHINTGSDSEILLHVLADEFADIGKSCLQAADVFKAVARLHRRIVGAYSVVAEINRHGILGLRDPYGIRPLVLGSRQWRGKTEYMIASETVAFDALGFALVRDILPGEAVFIDHTGNLFARQCADNTKRVPCIFEYVYLLRPDSMFENVSVSKARKRMGECLAKTILKEWPNHDIDVVIPIPKTSEDISPYMANALGVEHRKGFQRNDYIPRTFIMPKREMRETSLKLKLNPIPLEFKGKKVLLVDDSIVRGTTSRKIVSMVREAGAKQVYLASAAPPIQFPNIYGIDMPSAYDLIARGGRTIDEIACEINVDRLFYQALSDLRFAVREGNHELTTFEESMFTGHYVTGTPDHAYFERLRETRPPQ